MDSACKMRADSWSWNSLVELRRIAAYLVPSVPTFDVFVFVRGFTFDHDYVTNRQLQIIHLPPLIRILVRVAVELVQDLHKVSIRKIDHGSRDRWLLGDFHVKIFPLRFCFVDVGRVET